MAGRRSCSKRLGWFPIPCRVPCLFCLFCHQLPVPSPNGCTTTRKIKGSPAFRPSVSDAWAHGLCTSRPVCVCVCVSCSLPSLVASPLTPHFPRISRIPRFLLIHFLFLPPSSSSSPPPTFNTTSQPLFYQRCFNASRFLFRAFLILFFDSYYLVHRALPPSPAHPPVAGIPLSHLAPTKPQTHHPLSILVLPSDPPLQGMIRLPNELLSSTRLQNRCELTQGTIPSPSTSTLLA